MSFIPADYVEPETAGKYFKLKVGPNRFRVLAPAIMGYEGWKTVGDKRQPVRWRDGEPIELDAADPETVKFFWAFPVWNPDAKRVQILKLTQSGIRKDMVALARNKKWGDPMEYDIVVSAVGDGLEREYSTQPDPKEPLSEEAASAWVNIEDKFDMDVYFENGDPFGDEKTA